MLRIVLVGLVAAAAAPAFADPPCLPGVDTITGNHGQLVACSGSTCLQFADGTAKPTSFQPPAVTAGPQPPLLTDGKGHTRACAGATCKPAGAKLVAAATHSTVPVTVTADASAAVVDGELWDVAADAKVPIAKPPKAPSSDPFAYAVGSVIVATWRNCADDFNCNDPIATIVDTQGKPIGKPFPDGRLVAVDAHHAAMVGDGRKLTAFDTDTGAQLGTIAMIPNGAIVGLAVDKVDDGVLGVAWIPTGSDHWIIARVAIASGKPPAIAWKRSLAVCPP